MSVTVYGASDDLIEVEGDVREEFNPEQHDAEGELMVFSTGDILRVRYSNQGVWRIESVGPRISVTITPAPEDDDDNYSDRVVVEGDVRWVVCANQIVFAS